METCVGHNHPIKGRIGRADFCESVQKADLKSRVSIDDSLVKAGMRREYARSLRGHRVTGTRPLRAWKTISLIVRFDSASVGRS